MMHSNIPEKPPMLILLSPAKSLDTTPQEYPLTPSQPRFIDHARSLVELLRRLSPAELGTLMSLSDALARLNYTRYAEWSPPFTPSNAKPAALMFDGDVYDGLAACTLTADDLAFAQTQVRILSGLYGLLRPLDLIQPYRLEMGTRLANPAGKDLYAFWGGALCAALNAELAASPRPVVVNLASEEYFKAAQGKKLAGAVIQPVFEDWKGGQYKVISFYAKRARGLMTRYAIENRLTDPEGLRDFAVDGYAFAETASDDATWVFRRRAT